MLNALHPATHENLQLGEGVLLRGIDLDAALHSARPGAELAAMMADPTRLIGATKAGCEFRCVPVMLDATQGHRTAALGETLTGRWEVTLSGTLLEITPENAAMLLNQPPRGSAGGQTVMQPEPTPLADACEDLCWLGDTGSGLLAIELQCPVSTGGMVFRASRDGLGEAAFTLMAHKRSPEQTGLPCRLMWLKEATA